VEARFPWHIPCDRLFAVLNLPLFQRTRSVTHTPQPSLRRWDRLPRLVQKTRPRQGAPPPPTQSLSPPHLFCPTQIEAAFAAGYDPALELASRSSKGSGSQEEGQADPASVVPWTEHMRRKEQDYIESIVYGQEQGHYFVLLGPKVRVLQLQEASC
jgi:hypothetical protein